MIESDIVIFYLNKNTYLSTEQIDNLQRIFTGIIPVFCSKESIIKLKNNLNCQCAIFRDKQFAKDNNVLFLNEGGILE